MNEAVYTQLRGSRLEVEVIDLSPKLTPDKCNYGGARRATWMRGLWRYVKLCLKARPSRLYIGMSGGLGQLADLLFISIARITSQHIVIHHHSFAYLNKKSFLMSLIVGAAGHDALHVMLCEKMVHSLQEVYGARLQSLLLSNAAMLTPFEEDPRVHAELRVIGMLSNLSLEKGVETFIDIVRQLRCRGVQIEGRLAGPAVDAKTRTIIMKSVEEGLVTWSGPIYGLDKQVFFNTIDVFVFPSRYVNEAEPLVIHEALAYGLPVIATDRGCIAGLVGNGGLVLDVALCDLTPAVSLLEEWWEKTHVFAEARSRARRRFTEIMSDAQEARGTFLARMSEGVTLLRSQ